VITGDQFYADFAHLKQASFLACLCFFTPPLTAAAYSWLTLHFRREEAHLKQAYIMTENANQW